MALLHYATHPTLMAHENRLITPDYPGVARRTVEAITGATCLFLQGCAGDIGPAWGSPRGHTGDTSYYHRAGKILGAEAARVFLTLETRPYGATFAGVLESGGPLGVYRHAPLPSRSARRPARCAWRRRRPSSRCARFPLTRKGAAPGGRSAGGPGHPAPGGRPGAGGGGGHLAGEADRPAGRPLPPDRRAAHGGGGAAGDPGGPGGALGAPMEVFNALGASVAEGSPFPWTAVSGYSNGSTGYLLTAEAFWARGLRGGDGQPLRPGGRGALRGGRATCCGACADRLLGGPLVEGLARGACLPTCLPAVLVDHLLQLLLHLAQPLLDGDRVVPHVVAPLVPHHAQVGCGGQVVGGRGRRP